MEAKYAQAIKAGIIGGIVLYVIFTVVLISQEILLYGNDLPHSSALSLVFLCLTGLPVIIVSAGTGALAVRYARPFLHTVIDAIAVSWFSGAISGVVFGFIFTVINFFIQVILSATMSQVKYNQAIHFLNPIELGTLSMVCGIFIILEYAISVSILAVIGGAVYALLISRIS